MTNTSTTLQIKDGIYDIQPPLTPELSSLDIFLLMAAIVFILGLILYFIWKTYFSSKGKIRRQIKQLSEAYKNNKINSHDAVYKLSYLLQKGLNINHIGRNIDLPESLNSCKDEWNNYADTLSALRYTTKHNEFPGLNKLFDKSLYWLKVW